jgi:hypothetical protein
MNVLASNSGVARKKMEMENVEMEKMEKEKIESNSDDSRSARVPAQVKEKSTETIGTPSSATLPSNKLPASPLMAKPSYSYSAGYEESKCKYCFALCSRRRRLTCLVASLTRRLLTRGMPTENKRKGAYLWTVHPRQQRRPSRKTCRRLATSYI